MRLDEPEPLSMLQQPQPALLLPMRVAGREAAETRQPAGLVSVLVHRARRTK